MNPVVVCIRRRRKAANYLDALRAVGVDTERLLVVSSEDHRMEDAELERLGAEAGGVVLAGGPDVAPERYGEAPRPDAGLSVVPELDRIEWALLKGIRASKTPTWAICRGMQTINVFLGGTLWQDLPSQQPHTGGHDVEEPEDHLAHEVEVSDRSTAFGALLASDRVAVNSRHHQAVKELAPDLRAVAYAPDGVLEVAEHREHDWWLRAVQWHPENLLALAHQRRLWEDFAEATAVDEN